MPLCATVCGKAGADLSCARVLVVCDCSGHPPCPEGTKADQTGPMQILYTCKVWARCDVMNSHFNMPHTFTCLSQVR